MAGHAWPWAARRTTTVRQPANGQREWEKTPQTRETTYQRESEPGEADEDPRESSYTERCSRQRRLEHIVDSDDRETATTSRNGRGPAPEVSCNPPAEYPRPPFVLQRETYCLELHGSCGRVQAALSDLCIMSVCIIEISTVYSTFMSSVMSVNHAWRGSPSTVNEQWINSCHINSNLKLS